MSSHDRQMLLRLSRFTHFVRVDDETTAIYNALSQEVLYVPADVASAIASVNALSAEQIVQKHFPAFENDAYNLLEALWTMRMLVGVGEDETDQLAPIQEILKMPRIMILYLILTDLCNIRCKYCFFEGGIPKGHRFTRMSVETAKKGIDLFARSLAPDAWTGPDSRPMIILYGGEALLNWEVARSALEYVALLKANGTLPESTRVTLNTNGTLLTPEIAEVLAYHKVNVAISVDGPKEVHDAMRVDPAGCGTFERVMIGFQNARKAGCNLSVCCTIDSHNLHILPTVASWIIEELGVKGFGFNTLLECNARRIPSPEPYAQKVAEALVECFKIARDHGVHEDRFMRKLTAFEEGVVYLSDCGGCGMQLVISPDGWVGTCHAYCGTHEYFVPLDDVFEPIKHPYWLEWRRRSPINMESCYDCSALGNCGGGCPHSAAIVNGSIWTVDTSFCPHARAAVDFLIRDLFRLHGEQL